MLCPLSSKAQRFELKSYSDGLVDLNIKCLLQDRSGFLWIGTHGGLYRYDGYQFREFGPESGITVSRIEDLIQDKAGNIWVAGTSGLFVQHLDRFEELRSKGKPIPSYIGSRLAVPAEGGVILSSTEGLYRIAPSPKGWTIRDALPIGVV